MRRLGTILLHFERGKRYVLMHHLCIPCIFTYLKHEAPGFLTLEHLSAILERFWRAIGALRAQNDHQIARDRPPRTAQNARDRRKNLRAFAARAAQKMRTFGVDLRHDKFFENVLQNLEWRTQQEMSRLDERVNRTLWTATPAVVNAYYSRNRNQISK